MTAAQRLAELAANEPRRTALRVATAHGEQGLTTADLADWSDRVAWMLIDAGVRPGTRVVSNLGNSLEHYVAAFATWKAGGCFVPVDPRAPQAEVAALVALTEPTAAVGTVTSNAFDTKVLAGAPSGRGSPPHVVADPGLALASGGSTGQPKLVVTPGPWGSLPMDFLSGTGWQPGQMQLVCGPVHHNGPFVMSYYGLLMGHSLVVLPQFDAARTLDLIEKHRVHAIFLVPTTMRRLLDEQLRHPRDVSSLRAVLHSAAPCPGWLKRSWIHLVGPEHLYEAYGASEGIGGAVIRGDEWLAHPGSVGRPYCEIRIRRADGSAAGFGEVGEIWARRHADGRSTYAYVGSAPAPRSADDFVTVGDLGSLDEDGFLYIADRRADLIITGGENVYPAEVEAALTEHPGVQDAVVVGVPDEVWGKRVHAVVQWRLAPADADPAELDAHCRLRLAPYKAPKSYAFVAELPRTEAGKIRRAAILRTQTEAAGWPSGDGTNKSERSNGAPVPFGTDEWFGRLERTIRELIAAYPDEATDGSFAETYTDPHEPEFGWWMRLRSRVLEWGATPDPEIRPHIRCDRGLAVQLLTVDVGSETANRLRSEGRRSGLLEVLGDLRTAPLVLARLHDAIAEWGAP